MKHSDFLKAAKALINTPDKWTQGRYKDVTGGVWCFCSVGAIYEINRVREYSISAYQSMGTPMRYLTKAVHSTTGDVESNVLDYNDKSSHVEVMAMWDIAIGQAMADEEAMADEAVI